MNNTIQRLEESIADNIKNYQKHLNNWIFDDRHVDKWIHQFPEDERIIVLKETDSLIKHSYMRKRTIKEFFDEIWRTKGIMETNPASTVSKIQFLDIQNKGESQKRLVGLLEKHYYKNNNVLINRRNNPEVQKYIYLDDCMFTGLTLIKDICNWIDNGKPNRNTKLDIVFLGIYNGNFEYVKKRVREKCLEKGIEVEFYWAYQYNNDIRNNMPPYDILWPLRIDDDENVNAYVQYMEEQKTNTGKGGLGFRNDYIIEEESELFTSTQNRVIYEKALLKQGAYIWSLPKSGNDRMKPMGYNHGISLGFGAFFATCYNISNNCPLAFWWGDLDSSPSETLGKWYPLLPREVNYK